MAPVDLAATRVDSVDECFKRAFDYFSVVHVRCSTCHSPRRDKKADLRARSDEVAMKWQPVIVAI